MKRLLLLPSAWLLLCAAGPVPVTVDPPRPQLGVPFRATIDPGRADVTLAGIPPLGAFALVGPPAMKSGRIHLELIPLRPGRHALPAFSLHQGRTGHLLSEVPTVDVDEGIDEGASPAPLKEWPGEGSTGQAGLPPWLLPVALLFLVPVLVRALPRLRRSFTPPRPPPLEALNGDELLAELQRRLEKFAPQEDDRWRELSRRVTEARFAPRTSAHPPRRLLSEFRSLGGET